MTEEKPRTEMIIPEFRKLPTTLNKAPRCVDGRPDYSIEDKGPQMLGGSLHPVVLWALEQGKPINQETVNQSLSVLKGEPNNFNLGDHRDTHTHDGHDACGCGFADRLPDIIKMAQDQRKEITNRLKSLGIKGIEESYDVISNYPLNKIQSKGEALLSRIENKGGTIETLDGDHNEVIAFVNLEENSTLDTNGLNRDGQQVFNLDLWAAIKQSQALGVSQAFAHDASLILYQATEMVLVEDNGKTPLPVQTHK